MAAARNLIGTQLRKLRIERGLSQRELAELLQRKGWDVSRGAIARIEGQVRWVADFELVFLAESLGKSVQAFLGEREVSKIVTQLIRDNQYSLE